MTATSAQTREVKAAPGSNISAPSQIQVSFTLKVLKGPILRDLYMPASNAKK